MKKNLFIFIAVCAMMTESDAFRAKRNSGSCGVSRAGMPLIIYGQSLPRKAFPWIVALNYTGENKPGFICGGTLISKTFVISAAHCILNKGATEKFQPQDILAFFGGHNLSEPNEPGRIELSPKEIYIHEDWDSLSENFDADISLLQFEKGSINFSSYIQPICLWSSENEPTVTQGVVIGWGKSEDENKPHEDSPKMVKAPIEDVLSCILENPIFVHISSKRTFCAGLRNGSGICEGDSGSGLVINVRGVYYLRGIVSSSPYNHEGCDVWNYAVYTNVLMFRNWIKGMTTAGKVFCTFTILDWQKTCRIDQAVDNEFFVLGSPKNTSIEWFTAHHNEKLNFLPRGIGEKFPNLKKFEADYCGLTIVRDFYFKNMEKLETLDLSLNQIKTIEPKAFDDLVTLRLLRLQINRIETLDEKLFVKLVNLEKIWLYENEIKSLSPTTFKIPDNQKLREVGLRYNACINKHYDDYFSPLSQLESDLKTKC